MIEVFSKVSIDSEATKPLRGRKPLCARDRWLTNTRNNIIWRCTNPKDKKFAFYGGRGIQTLIAALEAFVMAEDWYREEIISHNPAAYNDPLADAYKQASEVLAKARQ